MTDLELFDVLRKIVLAVTGVESILADQNQQAPKGEYASIRPRQSVRERGQANIIQTNVVNNRVKGEVRAQIICTASIQFWRGNALQSAEKMHQCNKRFDVNDLLLRNKLGWGGTDAVNNLTALQADNEEQRAQINVRLWYEARNESEVNAIIRADVIIQNEKAQELQRFRIPRN